MSDDWDRAVWALCCFWDVKCHIMPYYVAFSLFACLPALPACLPCLLTDWTGLFVKLFCLTSVPCFPALPCFSLPCPLPCLCPAYALPCMGWKALKIPEMGTKIACFAVYRSENRSKNLVNRQTQKDSHKIFCACCTNKSIRLTIFKIQNFYIPQMDFCKFHDAKNANPAKNAGAILALPTGQGDNARPWRRNRQGGEASFKRSRLMWHLRT